MADSSNNNVLTRPGLDYLFYSKLKPMYGHAPSYDVVGTEQTFVPSGHNPFPYVSYEQQTLDTEQKEQARRNIGAVGKDDPELKNIAYYDVVDTNMLKEGEYKPESSLY